MRPLLSGIAASIFLASSIIAQTSTLATPQARVVEAIDETSTVTLAGNVHPLIATATSSKPLDNSTPMQHMILHLKSDAAQEAALAQLVAGQKDPASPLYHQYLTPQSFGANFGVAAPDVAKVTAWLKGHGFTIDEVPAGSRSVIFSGTSGQVTAAFKTEIRSFNIAGVNHIANVSDPQIPAALSSVVAGIVQLHDFQSGRNLTKVTAISAAQAANPQYTDSTGHYMAPADFSTIYDLNPLYSAGVDGTGQSIAIVSRSNILVSDIEAFRMMYGLPANDPQIIVVTNDPGLTDGNSTETTLDTEWAGAVAPKALIKVLVGQCTNSSDGVVTSLLYAVNNNVAPIISVSYGQCEATLGTSAAAFYNSTWQQAAAQGQTVVVSSGDSGAAGCANPNSATATTAGINGMCSSPYSTCIGGTEFAEGADASQYWLPGNGAAYGSAIGYIPEIAWNESGLVSGGSNLNAGGGGPSIFWAKPSWQAGPGVPADGKRDVPDVALSAASHDGYAVFESRSGGLIFAGGTSFSAPAFAGFMALVNQKTGARQGVANSTLYNLAANQAAGGAAVFHDITLGNNSVPGVTGFSAAAGYDMATGLGSLDAALLVNHWSEGVSGISLSTPSAALTVSAGQTVEATITSLVSGTLNSAVSFSLTGAPAGTVATFTPATIAAPGNGSVTFRIPTTAATRLGTYTLIITGTGGGQTGTVSIALTLQAPTFLLATDKTSLSISAGASARVNVTTTVQTGFSFALSLLVTGAPAGVTAVLSTSTIPSPGNGAFVLSVTNTSATPTTFPLTISVSGGGKAVTAVISVCIPSFSVTSPSNYYNGSAGGSITIPVSVTPQSGFSANIGLSLSYLPSGITSSFSTSSVSGTAGGTSTLTLNIAGTVPNGVYILYIYGTGGGITQFDYVTLLVGVQGSCQLAVYNASHSAFAIPVTAGLTGAGQAICSGPLGTFNGALSVAFTGLPTGLTAQMAQPLVPGGGWSTVNITAAQGMAGGSYSFNLVASQGAFTTQYVVNVLVTPNSFSLTAPTALTLTAGTSAPLNAVVSHKGIFNSSVSLVWSGLPAGVSASLVKSTFFAPGDGTAMTTFSAAAGANPGDYTVTLTATGAGQTQAAPLVLTIAPPSCELAVNYTSGSTLSMFAGQTESVTASCSDVHGTFATPLTLSLNGAPAGVTAQTSSATMAAGGTTSVQVVTPINMAASVFSISLTATSGNFRKSVLVSVTVSPSNFTLAPAQTTTTINQASTGQVSTIVSHHGIFNSAVSLAWSGLPTGITASLSRSSLLPPGDGTVATTFNVLGGTAPGTYTPVLTVTGGGVTQTETLTLIVATPPSCNLQAAFAAGASTGSLTAGSSVQVAITCTSVQGNFTVPLTLHLSGSLPAGVSANWAQTTLPVGNQSSATLIISATQSVGAGNLNLSLTATSGPFTSTINIPIALTANSFTLTPSQATVTLVESGPATQVSAVVAHLGAFNSSVTLSWSAMPVGVTVSLSRSSTAAPGDGTVISTFNVASTARVGTYSATLTAVGGGVTKTAPLTLVVTK